MTNLSHLKKALSAPVISKAKINITNLRLRTYIGFNPEELNKQQDVVVNAEIHYCADNAMISDSAGDALDYKRITKRMIYHIENGRFQLLEKLTADLLAITMESDRVLHAEVRVDKPHALRFSDSVSLTLCSTRE